MSKMEITLYKFEVVCGKEDLAREWLDFLDMHKEEGVRLLKRERAFLEAYFTATENGVMYVYMFFAAKEIDFSNHAALNSQDALDMKHFEYMRNCINMNAGEIMDCRLCLDNLEDLGKY